MADIIQRVGLGPLVGLPTFFNTAVLSTTATIVTLPTLPATNTGGPGIIAVKIVNPNASALLAWTIIVTGGAVPSTTADFAATGGSTVLPGAVEHFAIPTGFDLYIVASAAASSAHVTSFLFT